MPVMQRQVWFSWTLGCSPEDAWCRDAVKDIKLRFDVTHHSKFPAGMHAGALRSAGRGTCGSGAAAQWGSPVP